MNEFVDRIFVINLATRPDKYKRMETHLHEMGLSNVERFEGVVPTVDMMRQHQTLCQSSCFAKGVLGCKQSHLDIIKLSKERGYKQIMVLEDDAVFEPEFREQQYTLIDEINSLSWSMVYLGANHKKKGITVTPHLKQVCQAWTTSSYLMHETIFDTILQTAHTMPIEIDSYYVRVIQPNGQCYAVSPNIARQYASVSDISGNYTNYEFEEC